MVAKCHRSSQSPWICDNGGRFAVNWSAWDHGRHLACHLDRWEGLLSVWDRCGASFGIFRCSPGDWWANLQDPFWTDLKERDGPGMEEEWALRGQQHQHRRQRASGGSRGWWVQRALWPWRLCVRSHEEPFWQRLLHQLPELLVPATLDFRCKGGFLSWKRPEFAETRGLYCPLLKIIISHCNDLYAGFTAVTKRSGIDGRRSKWLKGKHTIALALNSTALWRNLVFGGEEASKNVCGDIWRNLALKTWQAFLGNAQAQWKPWSFSVVQPYGPLENHFFSAPRPCTTLYSYYLSLNWVLEIQGVMLQKSSLNITDMTWHDLDSKKMKPSNFMHKRCMLCLILHWCCCLKIIIFCQKGSTFFEVQSSRVAG